MTMQIGMVGTDGVLLASDTRRTNTPRLRMNENIGRGSSEEDFYRPKDGRSRELQRNATCSLSKTPCDSTSYPVHGNYRVKLFLLASPMKAR
jgi:hypothetical protein